MLVRLKDVSKPECWSTASNVHLMWSRVRGRTIDIGKPVSPKQVEEKLRCGSDVYWEVVGASLKELNQIAEEVVGSPCAYEFLVCRHMLEIGD